MSNGDPSRCRFKVMRDGYRSPHGCRWRVFELMQPGQRTSRFYDLYFKQWEDAMAYADLCVRVSRFPGAHARERQEMRL